MKGALDVDIGANPSAEGAEDDEGVNDEAVKVVDIVDTFRLQVSTVKYISEVHVFCKSYVNVTSELYVDCLCEA